MCGSPAKLGVTLDGQLDDFRRYDISLGEALRLRTHCTGAYSSQGDALYDVICESPVGNGIVRVRGEDAAIACANDNAYGLSSAVFSRDTARAWGVAQRIESGICHINGPTVHDEAQMPFGGVKESGFGRFGGKAGIAEFTELRWITMQTAPRHYPF